MGAGHANSISPLAEGGWGLPPATVSPPHVAEPLGPRLRATAPWPPSRPDPRLRAQVGFGPFGLAEPGCGETPVMTPRDFFQHSKDCQPQRALSHGTGGGRRGHGFTFNCFSFSSPLSSFSSTSTHEMVRSAFKTKMVACYKRDSTSGEEGAGPQPAHAGSGLRFQDGDSLCN